MSDQSCIVFLGQIDQWHSNAANELADIGGWRESTDAPREDLEMTDLSSTFALMQRVRSGIPVV